MCWGGGGRGGGLDDTNKKNRGHLIIQTDIRSLFLQSLLHSRRSVLKARVAGGRQELGDGAGSKTRAFAGFSDEIMYPESAFITRG